MFQNAEDVKQIEDDISLAMHRQLIKDELVKKDPDFVKNKKSNEKDICLSKKFILVSTTATILEEYPALKIASEVSRFLNM